jgi:hypothetical protein
MSRRWVVAPACALLAACPGPSPTPPPSGEVPAEPGGASGFRHGFDRTRFAVGARYKQFRERDWLKRSGELGTVAINLRNGAEAGVSHGNRVAAEDARRSPAPNPDRHNQWVLDYFTKAGLPPTQVAGVDTLTLLAEEGKAWARPAARGVVTGYVSALRRSVNGVAVPESFAWAQVNGRGEVIQEGVFWPRVPPAALGAAAGLQRMIADPGARHALLGRFGANVLETRVAIHHSLPTQPGEVSMRATLDVAVREGAASSAHGDEASRAAARELHLDSHGAEVRLPSERQPAATETARTKR